MLKTWNGRALAMAAGAAAMAAAPAAHAGVIGCDASGGKQVAGAIIGGVLGGVAGNNIIKKDQQAGTIVGATAGAAAGSYVGCEMQKKDAAPPPPPARVRYEEAPPPPPRVRYEEAPPTYVVREPPPRTVVYEEAPPPPRTVYVRERDRDDDDDWDDDRWKHKRWKYRPDPRWSRDAYYAPRGHGRRYLIGERMPVTYVRREYVIYEPARYRLRPAPVGYSWVMYGGDAYLIGTETGLVAQVVRAILG